MLVMFSLTRASYLTNLSPDNFVNLSAANFLEEHDIEEASEAVSRTGSPPNVPSGSVRLELFRDYGISPNSSHLTSLANFEHPAATGSAASLSTDMSLSRRLDRGLDSTFGASGSNTPRSMFEQALGRSRDLQ